MQRLLQITLPAVSIFTPVFFSLDAHAASDDDTVPIWVTFRLCNREFEMKLMDLNELYHFFAHGSRYIPREYQQGVFWHDIMRE